MKRCVNCFRCVEYAGFRVRLGNFHYKPRKNWPVKCIAIDHDDFITQDSQACESYHSRWKWNIEVLWKWKIRHRFIGIFRHVSSAVGGYRKPVQIKWKDYYDVTNDVIIPKGEPECPCCGEMPYSMEQCVLCGQRFIKA